MASSTGETAPGSSSPAVAIAAPPPATPMEVKMGAGLLAAAACSGTFNKLESLLDGQTAAPSNGTVGNLAVQSASPPGDEEAFLRESLVYAVTAGGDTLLHVVAATTSYHEDFLKKAGFIYGKAPDLLFMQNSRGDTPLHCAARMANIQMVSLLIDLARGEDGSTNRVKALLRTENKINETALHAAAKSCFIGQYKVVKLLMEEDSQLASFPKDGTSPLYLAILLQRKSITKTLYELSDGVLSYSGPNGQNALHAAVLRGKDLTEMLLEWNKALTIQQDENGSTPLHLVASVLGQSDRRTIRALLLEANPDALYQPDNNGLFPIHVAASVDATLAISDFLKKSSRCAGLRDARGRTFLHVAVDKMKIRTVGSACRNRSLSWIFNMQDKEGNTALHLAIQKGSLTMFCALFGNRQVSLNLTNEKGETALDIARCNVPEGGLYYNQNSEVKIDLALKFAGAKCGISRRDYFEENDIIQERQDDNKNKEIVKEGTQTLCIGSVLIATVTFGATFAMPGGYRADDHINGGTPTLAGRYAFDAFTLANALAFTFATMATISLMSSGSSLYNLRSRIMHLGTAFYFIKISLTSLAAAFAIGTYMMISPVAHKAAIAVCVLSSLLLLYTNLELTIKNVVLIAPLCMRKGILWTLLTSVVVIIGNITVQLWPIIVIFCSTARNYPAGKVEPAVQPPTPFV
ncbi:ankyrin-1 isoform X1 [Triticum aestivum]|uniref:ankyrin-1 isoform X1 n=1 Tax=Triticum aestivum TaxID=4565 RepID=UPI001D02224A|nr:ankyrin-1-like isoform X1 [Triticum aestivum]